jgi:hypothetical protein
LGAEGEDEDERVGFGEDGIEDEDRVPVIWCIEGSEVCFVGIDVVVGGMLSARCALVEYLSLLQQDALGDNARLRGRVEKVVPGVVDGSGDSRSKDITA